MDLKLFARYTGYILQDMERQAVIAKIDKEKMDKERELAEKRRKAKEAREQWMREHDKL